MHVSELADHKVEDPHSEVKIGEKLLVKILRVDQGERKIGLSKKRAEWSAEQEGEPVSEKPARTLRGGLHGPGEKTSDRIANLPGNRTNLMDPDFLVEAKTSEETAPVEAETTPAEPADTVEESQAEATPDDESTAPAEETPPEATTP